ncbi:MAG: ribonuclease P protein component [Myxococcota bacterium]
MTRTLHAACILNPRPSTVALMNPEFRHQGDGKITALDCSFPKTLRLRHRSEFLHTQRTGTRVHTANFVIVICSNKHNTSRLGITVTKKVAGSVGRNRIKRAVREVFRCSISLFPARCDCVVIAKRGARHLAPCAVAQELSKAGRAMQRARHRAMANAQS